MNSTGLGGKNIFFAIFIFLTFRLLEKARTAAPSARLWMKSAHLEWCLGKLDAAKKLLQEGLMRCDFHLFPNVFER